MPRRDSDGPHFRFERAAWKCGQTPVCGIDEAGRGSWAGPVVAAAVILDPNNIPDGLDDSKKLSPDARERLFDLIAATAHIGIGIADVERIDRDNILAANFWAMTQAVAQLKIKPLLALVDGNRAPQLACTVQAIIEGDAHCASIAAASIVAKVTRDRLMIALDSDCPGYGFASHKGYGTAEHQSALVRLGPSPHHRRSFAPIRALNR